MAGGVMTTLYIALAIRLFAAVIPLLKEKANKTPNPFDDAAIAALEEFLVFANSQEFKTLLKT